MSRCITISTYTHYDDASDVAYHRYKLYIVDYFDAADILSIRLLQPTHIQVVFIITFCLSWFSKKYISYPCDRPRIFVPTAKVYLINCY